MARKPVIEVNCGRCSGTEYVDAFGAEKDTAVSVTFLGQTTVFEDLCSSCSKAVGNYINHIVNYRSKAKEKAGSESLPDQE